MSVENNNTPLPPHCRTCTQFLNDTLPYDNCYISCPQNNPIQEINDSLSLNTEQKARLTICPKCSKQSLFWNKFGLIYECLNPQCNKTYTVASLITAQINAEMERNYSGYMEANDGRDA